jgi:hypothetical protein
MALYLDVISGDQLISDAFKLYISILISIYYILLPYLQFLKQGPGRRRLPGRLQDDHCRD